MTSPNDMARPPAERYRDLLLDAVTVLTEAARLMRSDLDRTPHGHPADFAEFVGLALAGAAANVGGSEQVLHGRAGSRRANAVRTLLSCTVGDSDEHLFRHRTEPVEVDVHVREIFEDLDGDLPYEQAATALHDRWVARGRHPDADDELARLSDQLVQLRRSDRAAYGDALAAAVHVAARDCGITAPVTVNVHLDQRAPSDRAACEARPWTVAEELLAQAIHATPLPAERQPPLPRLSTHAARRSAGGADRSARPSTACAIRGADELTR